MGNEIMLYKSEEIERKIVSIRGTQVMLDRDLAELYGVETKRLNEQVKRNIERFPEDFMFQLDKGELEILKSQFATSSWGGNRKPPYAVTEQGVAMLSAVLRSETAVRMSVQIMKAFVAMRHFMLANAQVFTEIDNIKKHLVASDVHQKETDQKVEELFERMDRYKIDDTQGIFFQGQIFDAYAKFESFIQSAETEIVLIDNYVDLTVLERLAKKKRNVAVTIYTDHRTSLTAQDVQQFNAQYPMLTLNYTSKMHDRFLIIDGKTLYHIGASLKDLGKKCFAFNILDSNLINSVMNNL